MINSSVKLFGDFGGIMKRIKILCTIFLAVFILLLICSCGSTRGEATDPADEICEDDPPVKFNADPELFSYVYGFRVEWGEKLDMSGIDTAYKGSGYAFYPVKFNQAYNFYNADRFNGVKKFISAYLNLNLDEYDAVVRVPNGAVPIKGSEAVVFLQKARGNSSQSKDFPDSAHIVTSIQVCKVTDKETGEERQIKIAGFPIDKKNGNIRIIGEPELDSVTSAVNRMVTSRGKSFYLHDKMTEEQFKKFCEYPIDVGSQSGGYF